MWIKEHNDQNTFTVLEFQISQYLTQNIFFFKFWKLKVKIIKVPAAGFKLITYRFIVNAQTNCATLLDNNFMKEKIFKIILDFFVYFDRKHVTIWRCSILSTLKLRHKMSRALKV